MRIDIRDIADTTIKKIKKPKTDFEKFIESYFTEKGIIPYQYQIDFMKEIIENKDKKYIIRYPYRSGKSMMKECLEAYLKNLKKFDII